MCSNLTIQDFQKHPHYVLGDVAILEEPFYNRIHMDSINEPGGVSIPIKY